MVIVGPGGTRRAFEVGLGLMGLLLAFSAGAFAQAGEDESYKIARGLGVYLGVIPAAIVQGPVMHHGAAPRGRHKFHIVVAVFDADSGIRVENAQVTADISGLGHVGESSFALEPMSIGGTTTYGAFVDLPGNDLYDVQIDIAVPGREPAQVHFNYQQAR